jgi:xylan 1,4-beta-xylosidase
MRNYFKYQVRETMKNILVIVSLISLLGNDGSAQSTSFTTFMNPVIPGDHSDCTLTKVGNDFYTTGSSFNPTPVIYHSTDLVHWEAIAQPVSATWTNYGDAPAGGCWGGQVVYHNNKYWDYFCRNWAMYFVTADDIKGPWSTPTAMTTPAIVPGLGYDNSIFIDDDGKWFLCVKNGQVNNWIVELGDNGQPNGAIYNLCWINPAPSYPFSWAEGPVMWKYKGYYYYSFARDVSGGQKVLRSDSLTSDSTSWVNLGNFFNESDPLKGQAVFQNPNHASAAVMLDDGTSWVVHPLWRNGNNNEWYGQGRQGLLNQVRYDSTGKPTADYPINVPKTAPKLPSSGIPWMVPHTDAFDSDMLNPEWSFLGYTAATTYSLTTERGWLTMSAKSPAKANTIIKNDGEHSYSIITRLNFTPQSPGDDAGIQIFNGLQTLYAKLYSSIDSSGNKIIAFSYKTNYYKVENPSNNGGDIVVLKLVRVNHTLTGYFSSDNYQWTQVGSSINVADMENQQANYNSWTGNRQGLFVEGGSSAKFDYYIYHDAYTPILAECPANQYGTTLSSKINGISSLDNIHDNDWALYAGVEFGNDDYFRRPDSIKITASCATSGGTVEVWLDSLDSGTKIAECNISSTGSWNTYATFTANILTPFSGMHDVYLKFKGAGSDKLFMLQWLKFTDWVNPEISAVKSTTGNLPRRFELKQNYPNPFNPTTQINYFVPRASHVTLKVYNLLGQEVTTLFDEFRQPGTYSVLFNAKEISSGMYLYRMNADNFRATKKLLIIK